MKQKTGCGQFNALPPLLPADCNTDRVASDRIGIEVELGQYRVFGIQADQNACRVEFHGIDLQFQQALVGFHGPLGHGQVLEGAIDRQHHAGNAEATAGFVQLDGADAVAAVAQVLDGRRTADGAVFRG